MVKRLINWLFNREKPVKEPKVFNISGTWGNAIQWSNTAQFDKWSEKTKLDVHGWKTRKPKIGDLLEAEFTDSDTGEVNVLHFKFTNIDHCYDPPDMFFAKVQYVGRVA